MRINYKQTAISVYFYVIFHQNVSLLYLVYDVSILYSTCSLNATLIINIIGQATNMTFPY